MNEAAVAIFGVILGAVLAAVLTPWFTRWFLKPRPRIFIDEVIVSNDSIESSSFAYPDQSLIKACQDNPFVAYMTKDIRNQWRVDEVEYIKFLKETIYFIDSLINFRINKLKQVARDLQLHLGADNFDAFEDLFAAEQEFIWPLIEGSHIRNEFNYGKPEVDYSTMTPSRNFEPVRMRTDQFQPPQEFGVAVIRDTDNIVLHWGLRQVQQTKSKQFAERTAKAVSYRIKNDLNDIVNFLARKDFSRDLIDLKSELQRELDSYRRFVVRGYITNNGGEAFSVLNMAKLFIELRGSTIGNVVVSTNPSIPLKLGSKQDETDTPISTLAGSVQRFIAFSTMRLRELPLPEHGLPSQETLLAAFQGVAKPCYLGVYISLPSGDPIKPLYSPSRPFSILKTDPDIPANKK